MQLSTQDQALLRVGKANIKTLELFEEGVYLTSFMSKTVSQLRDQVCIDRMAMADRFVITGNKLMRTRPVESRSAVSRYYYAMYHAIRSVVYFYHKGDDHQDHSKLPSKLPGDFPNHGTWLNDLKDARLYRNDADYDPYPFGDKDWKPIAQDLSSKASSLTKIARMYLRQKGCVGA